VGLAAGILLIGHRLARRIGMVESLVVLLFSGVFLGRANANLTDLAGVR
jgi:hypothetical protein